MRSTPRAAARLSILIGLLFGLALILSSCGDDETAATGAGAAAQVKERSKAPGVRALPCQGQLDGFLDSLDALRGRLVAGLSYGMYLDEVREIRAGYDKIPFDRLMFDCVAAVGTPSEQAFDQYIKAANLWGECLEEVGCTSYSVAPKLQYRWRIASSLLSEAHVGSRGARTQ
ncbi:MAG: hypothetical protein WD827_08555 [Solirubrobacterales bacterium]